MAKALLKKRPTSKSETKRPPVKKVEKKSKPSIADTRNALEKLTTKHEALKEVRRELNKELKAKNAEIEALERDIEGWTEAEEAWNEKRNHFQAKIKILETQKISLNAQVSNLKNGNFGHEHSSVHVGRGGDEDDVKLIATLRATGLRQVEELKILKAALASKDQELASKAEEIDRLKKNSRKNG